MDREHASSEGDCEGTFWARGGEGLSRVKRHLWQDAREDEGEDCVEVGGRMRVELRTPEKVTPPITVSEPTPSIDHRLKLPEVTRRRLIYRIRNAGAK